LPGGECSTSTIESFSSIPISSYLADLHSGTASFTVGCDVPLAALGAPSASNRVSPKMSDARHSIQDLNPYNRFTHILQQEYVRSLTPSAYRELLDGDFAILQVLEPEIKAIIPKLDIENLRELIKSPKCILLLIVYYDFWIVQYKKDEHLDIQWRQSRNRAKYLAIMMVISDHAFWLADYILKRYPWHLDKRVRGENVSPEDRQLTDRVLADMIFSMAVDENAIESQRLDCQYWKRVEPDMLSWDIEDDSKQRFLFSIFEREHHLGTIESFVDMLDAYPIVSSRPFSFTS
jgi:hypothetical protein